MKRLPKDQGVILVFVLSMLILFFGNPYVSISYANSATRLVSITGEDSGDCITNPCRTIQFAINQAVDGDTIKVLHGIYTEKLAISSRRNLRIQGENATTTIIQGDHTFSQIRIRSSTDITISNFTVRDGGNRSSNEGGAVQIFGKDPNSSVVLQNLILVSNEAVNGGAIAVEDGDVKIINCILFDNEASNGGGAMSVRRDSHATIENTTVVNNTANFLAGGVINEAQLLVGNSIFWNNNLQQINTFAGGAGGAVTTVSFSDIEGGHEGLSNIDQNPLFVDELNHNFRLSKGSPAIDAGNPELCPSTDQDNFQRPIDGDGNSVAICDIGAYEFDADNEILVVNDSLTFVPDPSTYSFTDAIDCPFDFSGTFSFDAMLTNTGNTILSDLVVQVVELTNRNQLKNTNNDIKRAGATIHVDSTFNPNDSTDVTFEICVKERKPFRLLVDVWREVLQE